ncbi:tetratricopeptide repeat protein [Bacteroides sp.]|uniref:tetratricopeptide repeat protein n=1 Tax=Bacteroides sp. TaxID=29523 RepID=UPI002586F0F1|nr:tetratricopeptide repeat protein [Bacteroides sp.]
MNTIENTHPSMSLKSLPVLFAALCVLLCLTACRPKPYPSLLLAADSLASVLPDSACALLASYAADTADEPLYVRMYYRLLCIKAKDKAYIVHTSDSAILPVVTYYEHHKRLPHLPEAYYYAGRVYRDLGDAPQALAYFQRALDAMREDEDMVLRSRIYSQMGVLLKQQNLYFEALDAYRQSLECFKVLKDSANIAYTYSLLGGLFLNLEQQDSTVFYYRNSYKLCRLLNRTDLENEIQSQLARLYVEQEQYEAAHFALQRALRNVARFNQSGIYSIAADYYHKVGQIDSAQWYYDKLLSCGTLYVQEWANRGLAEITLAEGKTVPAAQYLYQALLLGDSIHKLTKTDEVRNAHSHYNYQLREQENQRLKLQNLRQRQTNVAILVVFVLFACGGTLYYLHRRKVMRLRLQVAEQLQAEAYRNSVQYQEDTRRRISLLEEQLQSASHQLTDSESRCRQLTDEKQLLAHTLRCLEEEEQRRRLMKQRFSVSDACLLFRKKETTAAPVTEDDWQQLETEADQLLDGFLRKLTTGPVRVSRQELRVSLLIRADFSIKSIAAFLHLTPTAVTSIRRRLSVKFSLPESSPQAWDEFVRSL